MLTYIQALLRSFLLYKNLIGHEGNEDHNSVEAVSTPLPSFPPSPEDSAVKAYMDMQTNRGPSRSNPLILWSSTMLHPWNQKVLDLLLDDFPNYAKEKQLLKLTQLLGKSIGANTDILQLLNMIIAPNDVKKLLEDKLEAARQKTQALIRRVHRMQKPALTPTPLTDNEIRSELQKIKLDDLRKARHAERRNLVSCTHLLSPVFIAHLLIRGIFVGTKS